jgi:hypothetical protein
VWPNFAIHPPTPPYGTDDAQPLFQQLIPFIKRWHMVQEITAEDQANGEEYSINASFSEPDYQDEDVHLGAESFIRRVMLLEFSGNDT